MSRTREGRVAKLRKRATIVKNVGCKNCSNDKMHYDGHRAWCTKCKHDYDNIKYVQRIKVAQQKQEVE